MKNAVDEIVDNVFTRWGKWCRPVLDRKDAGRLLAISVGLGTIFNENPAAEKAWMSKMHPELRCSPFHAVATGRLQDVLELVNRERGL